MRAPLIECPPPALQRAGTSRWGSRCRPRECGGCGGEAPCAAAPPRGSRSAPTRPERGSAQKCARVRVRSFRESPLRAESSPDAKWRGPLERFSPCLRAKPRFRRCCCSKIPDRLCRSFRTVRHGVVHRGLPEFVRRTRPLGRRRSPGITAMSVSRAPRRRGLRNRHPSAPRASARWRKSRPRPARSARTGRRPCRARGPG